MTIQILQMSQFKILSKELFLPQQFNNAGLPKFQFILNKFHLYLHLSLIFCVCYFEKWKSDLN